MLSWRRTHLLCFLCIFGILSFFVFTTDRVHAATSTPVGGEVGNPTVTPLPAGQPRPWLPNSVIQCAVDGKCSLDMLVETAVAFVNYLFGIAGAITLCVFVYAGILYFVGAVEEKQIAHAKSMMRSALIGLLIMFGASTLVRFVVITLTRQTPGPTACEQLRELGGYSCMVMPGKNAKEYKAAADTWGCVDQKQNLCAGNPENVYCCPLEPVKKPAKTTPATRTP